MTSICVTLRHTAFVPTLQLRCISAAEKGLVVKTGTDSVGAEGYLQRCVGSPYSLLTHVIPGSNLRFLHSACFECWNPPQVWIYKYMLQEETVCTRSLSRKHKFSTLKPSWCSLLCTSSVRADSSVHATTVYRGTVILTSLLLVMIIIIITNNT